MSNEQPLGPEIVEDSTFGDVLKQFEQSKTGKPVTSEGREATVIAISGDLVFLDVGLKEEGTLPAASLRDGAGALQAKVGDKMKVSITGHDPQGYYNLSLIKFDKPKDWSALEKAFAEKATINGRVTGLIKGGVTVDVGSRAFMPASRSGAKDVAEMEKLVGQDISCKVIKLDVADEDVVVDRRVVLEEEEKAAKESKFGELQEGMVVAGTVRGLMDYGAFVDIGGVDGMLHVAEISWGRVAKPSDVLTIGQQVQVQILKVDAKKRRISLGMKQLQPDPWSLAGDKYKIGDRATGKVSRVTDFGAFVELEPGMDGLIHLSEMSWSKKVRKPADLVKPGDSVDVVVLGVNGTEHRISLGLKQLAVDPWADADTRFAPGTIVEGKVTSLTNFGAFIAVAEEIEGMVHVGDLTNEKRLNHPNEVLKMGETVKAQVLEIDKGKRRLRLGVKQLQPTSVDEYITEHKEGDVVTGRVADVTKGRIQVELGEGVRATCALPGEEKEESPSTVKADVSSLSSMLANKWKKGQADTSAPAKKEAARAGQVRSFKITKLDAEKKRIEIEMVS
jgi:small subunit ribosomal protein S1